jgi:hypothetical protein
LWSWSRSRRSSCCSTAAADRTEELTSLGSTKVSIAGKSLSWEVQERAWDSTREVVVGDIELREIDGECEVRDGAREGVVTQVQEVKMQEGVQRGTRDWTTEVVVLQTQVREVRPEAGQVAWQRPVEGVVAQKQAVHMAAVAQLPRKRTRKPVVVKADDAQLVQLPQAA